MSWDHFDSRQVCVRNRYGDLESLGRIYRNPWDGGVVYSVNVYGASEQPLGTFDTIADARAYIIAEGTRVSVELGTMVASCPVRGDHMSKLTEAECVSCGAEDADDKAVPA